jgi:hypothetical protein
MTLTLCIFMQRAVCSYMPPHERQSMTCLLCGLLYGCKHVDSPEFNVKVPVAHEVLRMNQLDLASNANCFVRYHLHKEHSA